jgi:endonuclease YncB( thermonuclease family)
VVDRDRYRRAVARCFVGERDLNGWIVSEGLAVAYTSYSVRYLPAEKMGRLNGTGIWEGDFDLPWELRPGRRTIGEGCR